MPQSTQALRSRIKSVKSTRKITKAMEMIANAKLFRQRNRMEANREYARRLQETVNEIVVSNPTVDSEYIKKGGEENPRMLTIMFASDLGLCGAYNQNVMKKAREVCRLEDPMVVIGTSMYRTMQDFGYSLRNDAPIETDKLTYEELKSYVDQGIREYINGEIGGIQIVYTMFVNTMTFRPAVDKILPCEMKEPEVQETSSDTEAHALKKETLFEPDEETILNTLMPLMINNVAYADWMESSTAEQGSRRMAMKTASDNADELGEALLLEYNKARQAAITQEITEIVGGSAAV